MEELIKCDMDVIVVDHDGTSVDYFETLNEIPGCCWKLDPNNIPFSWFFNTSVCNYKDKQTIGDESFCSVLREVDDAFVYQSLYNV